MATRKPRYVRENYIFYEKFPAELKEIGDISDTYFTYGPKEMSLDDFELLSNIGSGSFATVRLIKKVTGQDRNRRYALKQVTRQAIKEFPGSAVMIKRELEILKATKHCPFLVQLMYAFKSPDALNFVLQYCNRGDLDEIRDRVGILSENDAKFYVYEIALGLEQLHSRKIIHRDLKPENILIKNDGHVAVSDFGLSYMFSDSEKEELYEKVGTLEFQAAEMFLLQAYSYPVDWWSLGCIAYELVTGHNPFVNKYGYTPEESIVKRIRCADPILPVHVGLYYKDFLQRLLAKDPSERLGSTKGALEIRNHTLFVDYLPTEDKVPHYFYARHFLNIEDHEDVDLLNQLHGIECDNYKIHGNLGYLKSQRRKSVCDKKRRSSVGSIITEQYSIPMTRLKRRRLKEIFDLDEENKF